MSEKKSDFPTAAAGFFVGVLALAAVLYLISNRTTAYFEGKEGTTKAAEHKAP